MNCRKCDKPIGDGEYKMVAEWPFCLECFELLLRPPAPAVSAADRGSPAARPPAPAADAPAADAPAPAPPPNVSFSFSASMTPEATTAAPAARTARQCLICEQPLAGDAGQQIGSWAFCGSCFAALTSPSALAALAAEEEEAPAPDQGPKRPPRDLYELGRAERVQCAGCGRRVPAGGVRPIDDALYCPECFKLRSATSARPAAAIAEPRSDEQGAEQAAGCASCGQPAPADALQIVEGFALCNACRATDPDLALHLARTRHRRHLQRLRDELGE